MKYLVMFGWNGNTEHIACDTIEEAREKIAEIQSHAKVGPTIVLAEVIDVLNRPEPTIQAVVPPIEPTLVPPIEPTLPDSGSTT